VGLYRPNRLWWRYTAWWVLAWSGNAVVGVALVLLRAISPPFSTSSNPLA